MACGHGDTILLRLPVDKWVLVDCYLPKEDGTRQRFFEFVASQNIQRLEYVFLTHPHYDHFLGMAEVLEHFTRDERSVGVFCDGGMDGYQVQDLLDLKLGTSSYKKLYRLLEQLDAAGEIEIFTIDENHRPICPKGFEGRVELVPIAPNPTSRRRLVRKDVRTLGDNPNAKLEANALSIVLVLSIQDAGGDWNVMLAGDAGVPELDSALSTWGERAEEHKRSSALDVVKVPHHGSDHSHANTLCKATRRGEEPRVAVISAGTRPGLPHGTVLKSYLDEGWTVLNTTKRVARTPRSSPLALANRKGPPPSDPHSNDIKISWNSTDGMKWEPAEAEIHRVDLFLY